MLFLPFKFISLILQSFLIPSFSPPFIFTIFRLLSPFSILPSFLPSFLTYLTSSFFTSFPFVDREAVDYIVNPSDLMNLGKDTGRLDGEMSSSNRRGKNKDNNEGTNSDNDNSDNDDSDNDSGDGEKVKKNGKRLRMSLQKGEVWCRIRSYVVPLLIY